VLDREQLVAAGAADFELVVHSPEQIELLRAAPSGVQFKVWLKLDSGMNRLGFKGEAFRAAQRRIGRVLRAKSAGQPDHHLASADTTELPDHSRTTDGVWHCDAIFGGRTQRLELGRIIGLCGLASRLGPAGLLLYGVSPFQAFRQAADHGLRPVMTLHSKIIAVKDLVVGDQVAMAATGPRHAPRVWRSPPLVMAMDIRVAPRPALPCWSTANTRP